MKLRLLMATATFAAALIGAVPAASAQGVVIDEGGVRMAPPSMNRGDDRYDNRYDNRNDYNGDVGPREARRIARRAGVADVDDVDRRGRVWIVEGEDSRGRDIRVTISARTGEVLDVQRRRR